MTAPTPSAAALHAELNQLREAVENAYQRNRRLESIMRELLGEASAAVTVSVFDVFAPKQRPPIALPERRRRQHESFWPTARSTPHGLRPTPGDANLTLAKLGLPNVGISVCGLAEGTLRRILEVMAAKLSADRNFIPVFLTDSVAPELFRQHRFAFEYFPMAAGSRILAGCYRWEDYAAEREALLRRKYSIETIIRFGPTGFCQPG
jgi:hypothetical protein